MAFDPAKLEEKIDRTVTSGLAIDDSSFGLEMKTMVDAMEFAKVMSLSKQAIPLYMRNEPGLCLAIVTRSLRWRLDPYFVAEQSYLTVNPKTKEERVAFMAQLFNAVINKAQPFILEEKLRVRYDGTGMDLKAIIYGIPKGETAPIEYETPTLGARIKKIGRNDGGYLKGSPLYDDDPPQALWYFGSRGFIRRYFPEVLAGAYSNEDLEEAGFERMRDVTPRPGADTAGENLPAKTSLIDRLKSSKRAAARGFNADTVAAEAAKAAGGASRDATTEEKKDHGEGSNERGAEAHQADEAGNPAGGDGAPVRDGEREPATDGQGGSAEQGGSSPPAIADVDAGGSAAGGGTEGAAEPEIIPPDTAGSGKRRTRR